MAVNWIAMRDEWETTDISLNDIANKYGVKLGTLKSRKAREKWEKLLGAPTARARTPMQRAAERAIQSATDEALNAKPEIIVTRVESAQPARAYARPTVNAPWLKHLPDEVRELMKDMEEVDPIDILYDQIRMQWAMIIRAQDIMFVSGQEDIDKFKTSSSMESDSWEVHTSWDKHGKFMTAMATAQKELRFLIQQFMDVAPVEDERRVRLANIEANTELVQQRVKALKGSVKDTSMLDVLISAVQGGQS